MNREMFKIYLIESGYKETRVRGNTRNVSDYGKVIDFVCMNEGITFQQLYRNIYIIVDKYDIGGEKEYFGNKKGRVVINALKELQRLKYFS